MSTSPIPYHFFFYLPPAPRALHSFPTRRSSDLRGGGIRALADPACAGLECSSGFGHGGELLQGYESSRKSSRELSSYERSEEHTSELQSRGHLVCRLLLEKKKRKNTQRLYVHYH